MRLFKKKLIKHRPEKTNNANVRNWESFAKRNDHKCNVCSHALFAAKIWGSNGGGIVIGRLELMRLLEVHFRFIKLLLPNHNYLQGEMMHCLCYTFFFRVHHHTNSTTAFYDFEKPRTQNITQWSDHFQNAIIIPHKSISKIYTYHIDHSVAVSKSKMNN